MQQSNRTWAQRLLTKPIWWWQRNRPYPACQQVWSLPPLAWATEGKPVFMVLTTPAGLTNAAWTAYSFGQRLRYHASLVITLDGIWTNKDRTRVSALFPGVRLRETATELAALESRIPSLIQLAAKHPMGRKIAAVVAQQERGSLLFADDDLLAFGDLDELVSTLEDGVTGCRYIREQDGEMQQDPALMAIARARNLSWIKDINVGLFTLPRDTFSIDLIEDILGQLRTTDSWFPDTVLFSILLARIPHQALPASYLVSTLGQFYFEPSPDVKTLQVRHYVGPVRHLMYAEGVPHVLKQAATFAA